MIVEELQKISSQQKSLEEERRLGLSLERRFSEMKADIIEIIENMFDEKVGEITTRVRSMIKDGKDGRDGQTPSKESLKAIIREVMPSKEVNLNKKLSVENIEGLDNRLNELSNKISKLGSNNRGGGGSTVVTVDLSPQLDGVTKTFSVSKKIGTPISLAGTQFPTILRPGVDYTWGLNSITLTDEVGAPESGQTLMFSYIEG